MARYAIYGAVAAVNVGYELEEEQLREYFAHYGTVLDVYLPRYAHGRNKARPRALTHVLETATLQTRFAHAARRNKRAGTASLPSPLFWEAPR